MPATTLPRNIAVDTTTRAFAIATIWALRILDALGGGSLWNNYKKEPSGRLFRAIKAPHITGTNNDNGKNINGKMEPYRRLLGISILQVLTMIMFNGKDNNGNRVPKPCPKP